MWHGLDLYVVVGLVMCFFEITILKCCVFESGCQQSKLKMGTCIAKRKANGQGLYCVNGLHLKIFYISPIFF